MHQLYLHYRPQHPLSILSSLLPCLAKIRSDAPGKPTYFAHLEKTLIERYFVLSSLCTFQTGLMVTPGPDLIFRRPQAGANLHCCSHAHSQWLLLGAASPCLAVILFGYTLSSSSSCVLTQQACCLQKRTLRDSGLQEPFGALRHWISLLL